MCARVDAEVVRIACVGDSITKGTGLGDPETESLPAQLKAFLLANRPHAVDVRNFGEGGAGILRRGYNPFWETDQYGDALAFDPHVLVVLLGTADSRKEFWDSNHSHMLSAKEDLFASFAEEEKRKAVVNGAFEFEQDLEDMVDIFRRMPSHLQVFLCTSVPMFETHGWLDQQILRTEIAPRIRSVAARNGFHVVELLDSALAQRPDFFGDGLHPNAEGAAVIAALIGQALLKEHFEQDGSVKLLSSGERMLKGQSLGEDHDGGLTCQCESALDVEGRLIENERQIVMRELHSMLVGQGF